MSDSPPKTTAELLARVDRAWEALEGTVSRLTPAQLTEIRDAEGWTVKDHLMHVAVWEAAFLGRFAGRPIHEVLGLDEAILTQDEDTVNAVLFERHRHRSLAEVLDTANANHRAARTRLAALADRAIAGTVADILPGASGGAWAQSAYGGSDPAAAWIGGNTWEHYDAHHGWIRALVERR
jgi:uncharacterized damage-inducible protein DinB